MQEQIPAFLCLFLGGEIGILVLRTCATLARTLPRQAGAPLLYASILVPLLRSQVRYKSLRLYLCSSAEKWDFGAAHLCHFVARTLPTPRLALHSCMQTCPFRYYGTSCLQIPVENSWHKTLNMQNSRDSLFL